jgi:hypothetical protein
MKVYFLRNTQYFELYSELAEMPGVAQDSIRNEGIREINYGII